MAKLVDVEGIGERNAQKLKDAGVGTTQALLEKGASSEGRREIEEKAGVTHAQLLRWVNHVDLFRIKGVAEEYSDLLEAAGVDTVPELAQRNAANLYQRLVEVNRQRKLVRQLPSEIQVADWIEQAKRLPRVLTY